MQLQIDGAVLRPLIAEVVREVLAQLRKADAALPEGKLAFSEAEAARLLGLNPWQLRDERLRGKITAAKVVGRRVQYSREDLVAYLTGRRAGETS
jgi:hypothetical protein